MKKNETWKTRTRNKLFAVWLICSQIFNLAIICGWLFLNRSDAPALFIAVNGPTGLWGALNSVSIAWEKRKEVAK